MRLLLLNQFVPPEGAPTARLMGDLADHLREQGHDVVCIGAAKNYRQSASGMAARLFRDLRAHLVLAWKTLTAGPTDWIVCLSDPPGLPFTASILARLKGARLAHWAMDVYPDVAVALGALPDGSPARWVRRAMRWGYQSCALLAALDVDMATRIRTEPGPGVVTCPPWPPALPDNPTPCGALRNLRAQHPGARLWLYSGNLGRAHEFECLLRAQSDLEARGSSWHLVFQGGGAGRQAARRLADQLQLKQCHWLPYADDAEFLDSMLSADVLAATQRESMKGLIWPSKLALMQWVSRPILWVGPEAGAIAIDLRQRGGDHGVFRPSESAQIADWIGQQTADRADIETGTIRERITDSRARGLRQWTQWLQIEE